MEPSAEAFGVPTEWGN